MANFRRIPSQKEPNGSILGCALWNDDEVRILKDKLDKIGRTLPKIGLINFLSNFLRMKQNKGERNNG